jgi:arsenate reductase
MSTPSKHKILFVCIHNSARSQMAEAFLNKFGGDLFEAESAGLEPGTLNPNVATVMQEVGINLDGKSTQGVFDLFRNGRSYNAVITVCDREAAERCPIFPGVVRRIAWSFPDPSTFQGAPDEILRQTRLVRDEIEQAIKSFICQASQISYWIQPAETSN